VISDTTYEAYNDWGGRSLYGYSNIIDGEPASPTDFASRSAVWPQGPMRAPYALTVAFDRPQDGRYETHGHRWTYWERPFLQWALAQGIALDVCTMRDLHFSAINSQYKSVVFTGHHEYWSSQMRTNVQSFAANNGNAIFLSGNVCWWQVRISPNGSFMACSKNKTFDPGQGSLTTVNWYDAPVYDSETSLTGVSYFPGANEVVYPSPSVYYITAENASSDLLYRGTGLGDFSWFGSYNDGSDTVVGPETDRRQSTTPSGFKLLAAAYLGGAESASMGYFWTSSGASRTITTATMNWTLGLSQDYLHWNPVDQITLNILNDTALGADLAYGATATASSSYEASPWSLSNLLDGNRRTGYCSQIAENDPSKSVNHTEWVVITLPASKTFSKVVLYPRNDGPYEGDGFPINFQIQVWDGAEWLTRVTVTNAAPVGSQRMVYTWGFSDTTNMIRIYATNLRTIVPADGYLLQLAQVTVHA
jgi:hypothetical protein